MNLKSSLFSDLIFFGKNFKIENPLKGNILDTEEKDGTNWNEINR